MSRSGRPFATFQFLRSFDTLSHFSDSRLEPHLVVIAVSKCNRPLWIFSEPHGEPLTHEVALGSANKGNKGKKNSIMALLDDGRHM
jgi:hypothetical protein